MTTPSNLITRYVAVFRSGMAENPDPDDARRRRRAVVVATLCVGVPVNAWALRVAPGDPVFYLATAILAAVWIIGAYASGPIHLGREPDRGEARPLGSSLTLAAALVVIFCLGALVVSAVAVLREPVQGLLEHASAGNIVFVAILTAVNGVAEELFHRGAVYSAAPRHRGIMVSTIVYGLVTATSGIPLLVVAAVLLGLVTAIQRRCTGGVLGPIVTHVAWSMTMLFALGPLLDPSTTFV